jgi:DAK2 domain fusion protein YloV
VLKKAGVVDAGGMGYVFLLKSMRNELHGVAAPENAGDAAEETSAPFAAFRTEDITFGYCTEFICARESKKNPEDLRSFLGGMGDSLVLVDDEDIIKVHVHTNNPGRVLEEALSYGALLTVKVENMREQHTTLVDSGQGTADSQTGAENAEKKRYGFVSVCAGSGLETLFRELGADEVVGGGQTMNPSTEDILQKVAKVPADIVYILPNNKNIIMAAQQCVPLAENQNVIVLPSKTVPQGLSALLAMDFEGEEADNTCTMEDAMGNVATLEITRAARDASFDGAEIKDGDYLALLDGGLFCTGEEADPIFRRAADEARERGAEFISVFYGEGVSEAQGEAAANHFRTACPGAEVTVVNGEQPVYEYLISME